MSLGHTHYIPGPKLARRICFVGTSPFGPTLFLCIVRLRPTNPPRSNWSSSAPITTMGPSSNTKSTTTTTTAHSISSQGKKCNLRITLVSSKDRNRRQQSRHHRLQPNSLHTGNKNRSLIYGNVVAVTEFNIGSNSS